MSAQSVQREDKRWNLFMKFLLVYPFLIRGLYLLQQAFIPFYMNPICLMDLVRESAPDHWNLHPIWKHFHEDAGTTCEKITGKPLREFFLMNYKSGVMEYYVFWTVMLAACAYCLYVYARHLLSGKVRSIIGFLASCLLAFNHGSLFHLLSHYQNDAYHLNGNLQHHSSFSVEGDNATLVNTLPPGLMVNFTLNHFVIMVMAYFVARYFRLDVVQYLSLAHPFILLKMIVQLKVIHPYLHAEQKSWYGWPMNLLIDDYNGHVLCHHVDGYCLGDAPLYARFYDALLYCHGKIYEKGLLTFQSVPSILFNISLDYFLLACTFVFMFVTVALLSPLLPKSPEVHQLKSQKKE
eukprot:gene26646-32197_t